MKKIKTSLNLCKMGRAINKTMILSIQMISTFLQSSTDILSGVLKLLQTSQLSNYYLTYLKLTICSYHVTYAFQSESTLYSG